MKILVFDDNSEYIRGLRYHLQQAGYQVLLCTDATELADTIKREAPDLVVVDQGQVEIAGSRPFTLEANRKAPLVLPLPLEQGTPSPQADDQASGDAGEPQREMAEAVLRRLHRLRRGNASRVKVGMLAVDFDRRRAAYHGQALALTPLQFKLLGVLALNAKRVVAYRDLLDQVWGHEAEDEEARELIKVHINRIRQRMRAIAPGVEPPIHAVRSFGYMLVGQKREPKEPQ